MADNRLALLARFGYHLISLVMIVVFLAHGCVGGARGRLRHRGADRVVVPRPRKTGSPRRGSTARWLPGCGVLSVAAVGAAAGVIAAMITRTGLGLQLNSILVNTARVSGNPTAVLIFTAIFAAVAVSVLGLAVPVTASFVISWVIVGPRCRSSAVPAPPVAMFVFYFAGCSRSDAADRAGAVAASAITGGRVIATMWQTKYTLPAFLVPFAFVLTDNGEGLLGRSFVDMVWTGAVGALAVAALAVVTGGWMIRRAGWPERALCAPAAALLLYLNPVTIAAGLVWRSAAVNVMAADDHRNHPISSLAISPIRRVHLDQAGPVALSALPRSHPRRSGRTAGRTPPALRDWTRY